MNRLKLKNLVLAVLLLAALLSLFFALRYGGVFGANPVPPVPAGVPSEAPAVKIAALEKKSAAGNGVSLKKKGGGKKLEEERKKRVSTLREPGEALINGVSQDTVPATGAALKKKTGNK